MLMYRKKILICPKCKKRVSHFVAYASNKSTSYGYDGNKFWFLNSSNDFENMVFVCPICCEIVSKNKEGIDYFIEKKFLQIKK